MAAIGLQSHIWNNNFKSILLLAFYPFLLGGIVWACAAAAGFFMMGTSGEPASAARALDFAAGFIGAYWPAVLGVALIWFMIAYFFHTSLVRRLARSHPVTPQEEPALYNLLENLCISQGMPMPRLEIIETHARNAFASGIDRKSYTITVTRGLLQSLTKDEVEAVLAHELTHILNRDVRLLIITIIFTGMVGFAAQMAWNSVRYSLWRAPRRVRGGSTGSSRNRGAGVIFILAVLAILWAGYLATLLTRFALSRRREYMADAGAIQITKNPEAMMRALMRIAGMDRIPEVTEDIAMMCVENNKRFMGLFLTHPPIAERIQAISETTNTPQPALRPKERASGAARFAKPLEGRDNWLTRQRPVRRKNPWITDK